MDFVTAILSNWQELLTAAMAVVGTLAAFLAALYGFFLLIPGDQPDKTIKAVLDFTTRLSRKSVIVLFAVGLCFAVVACAGIDRNTCLARVASSEVAVTESYETAVALLKADIIDKEKAKYATQFIDSANAAIDSAGRLCLIDEPKAQNYLLEAANLLLTANQILGE